MSNGPDREAFAELVFPGSGETVALCRALDWSATPLGPVADWPQSLRTAAAVVLESDVPMALLWGDALAPIYNDAFRPLVGELHPRALGDPAVARAAAWWPGDALARAVYAGERRRDPGRELHGEWSLAWSPVRDERGDPAGLLAAATPEARDSQERYRLIMEGARDYAIMTVQEGGLIESWSPGAEAVFGWTAEEAVGAQIDMLFTPEDLAAGVPERERSIAAEAGWAPDVRWHVRHDGSRVFIDGSIRALSISPGEARRFIKIGQDVTERRRVEEALQESEARYRSLFEHAALGIGRVRFSDARWIDVNEALATMVGLTREELLQTPWPDITHPDDLHLDLVPFQRMARGEVERYTVEKRFIHRDGHPVWARLSLSLVRDAEGRPAYEIAVVEDITDRRAAEAERDRLLQAVLRSEERYALVRQATNEVIWDWDLTTDELTWNEALEPTFGYERKGIEPVIDFWYDHMHPDDRDRVKASILGAIHGGDAMWSAEYRFRRADGSYAAVYDRGVIARSESGLPTRMIGSMLDVSERERLLASERDARRDAEAANKAKADFLASMSHELRTPLNAIGGYVDLLDLGVHGPLNDGQRAALARVVANQRHLLGLINDVLAFARLEAGQVEFDLQPLDACALLEDVHRLVAPLAQAKDIAIHVPASDRPAIAMADEERVRQVLLNLIGNAIKFTHRGGRIDLAAVQAAAWIDVAVQDDGPGIPEDRQEQIFDAFVQVDRSLSRPQEGVGLGLAISRDLARGMGGDLTLSSTAGEGSRFTLRLPAAPVDALTL